VGRYRRDIRAAHERLAARDRRTLQHPRLGVVEYTTWGAGPAMILSHPLFGGFDVGAGLAQPYVGNHYQFVAPSRFGYLGSSLPRAATPADQADAYAWILDALGIQRTALLGYSAGGPSAIQFALRHADRTAALVLMASPLPGKAGRPPKPVAQLLYGSDSFFWALKQCAPSLFARILGMPRDHGRGITGLSCPL
jgi:2-hydroxy-6-oxonona-2,4-dienedioate hydrolase